MKEDFTKLRGVQFKKEADLTRLSTMRLSAKGDLLLVQDPAVLKDLLPSLQRPYRILGLGSNQILPSTTTDLYLKLDYPLDRKILDQFAEVYTLPATVPLWTLTAHAMKHKLKGWEVFTGIPANLGGAIAMNAGTNLGEIQELLKSVKVVTKDGYEKVIEVGPKSFSYRHNHILNPGDLITEAVLTHRGRTEGLDLVIKDYLQLRMRTQPLKEQSCGCIFKNHKESGLLAGQCLDQLGLKGMTYKNLRVSPIHANWIENHGASSSSDFKEFVDILSQRLKDGVGVEFELEVKI